MVISRMQSRAVSPRFSAALLALSITGSLILGAGTLARADDFSDKSDRFLKQRHNTEAPGTMVSVIMKVNGSLSSAAEGQLKAIRATIYNRLPLIDSVAMQLPVANLKALAALPFAKRLSEDVKVVKTDEFTVASSGANVAFQQYSLTGSGV